MADEQTYSPSDYEEYFKTKIAQKPVAEPVNEPKPVLQGRAVFTEPMLERDAQITKNIFPQPSDNGLQVAAKNIAYPLQMLANGAQSVPEDIGNMALGVAQQGVPNPQRKTVGDLLRMIDPGYITPSETNQAPQFQAAMQQHPVMSAAQTPLNILGGFAFPVGAAQGALMKAPLAVKNAIGPLGFAAKLGAAGREVPIARDVAQLMQKLNEGARLSPLQRLRTNPITAGAATGAAYAPIFSGGQQFGQTRNLQTPQEAAQSAALGGGLGVGLAGVGNGIQKLLLRAKLAQLAKQSPLDRIPNPNMQPSRSVLPSPERVASTVDDTVSRVIRHATATGDTQLLDRFASAYPRALEKRYAADSDENLPTIAKARSRMEKELLAAYKGQNRQQQVFANRQENRQYSEQRTAANRQDARQYGEQKLQQGIERHAGQTQTSDDYFREMSDLLDAATSTDDLRGVRNDIFATGHGPTGKPVLTGAQRGELQRQWREHYAAHHRRENPEAPPGESPGTPSAPRTVPTTSREPQTTPHPVAPPAPKSSPPADASSQAPGRSPDQRPDVTESDSTSRSTARRANQKTELSANQSLIDSTPQISSPVRDKLIGNFRVLVNPKKMGPREERYKYAVSVQSLAQAAALPREKTTALEQWVGDLARARNELTYVQQRKLQLVEWAINNVDEWIGEQTGNTKARQTTDQATQNDRYIELKKIGDEADLKKILLRAKFDQQFENATGQTVEREPVNMQQYGGEGEALRVISKPTVATTTNGIAKDWVQTKDGGLEVKGGITKLKLPEFKPPKNADELYDRLDDLLGWERHFEDKGSAIRNAKGEFNHLGDGTTPVDVMKEAFDKLKLPFIEGRAPMANVWHVDQSGHVSTTTFVQEKTTASLQDVVNERMEGFEKLKDALTDFVDKSGRIKYDALYESGRLPKLMAYVPGAETLIAGLFAGKQLHKLFSHAGHELGGSAIFAGTIRDILLDNVRLGGVELANQFDAMNGKILANFFQDKSGQWYHPKGAEDVAELLNEFKNLGGTPQQSAFRRVAMQGLDARQAKAEAIVQDDLNEAMKRADTAFMIRQHYKNAAKVVAQKLEEMKIRKRDGASGVASPEGKKFYAKNDYHDDGKLKKSVYDQTFDDAVQELYLALTLQPSKYGKGKNMAFDAIAGNRSRSIFKNNLSVGFKNFFDQAPLSIAYYDKHLMTAAVDLFGNPELRAAIDRTPAVAQADMHNLQLREELADNRKSENPVQAGVNLYKKLDDFLSNKLDFIFHGKSPIVSLADRNYYKLHVAASINRQADLLGYADRHDFQRRLIDGQLSKEHEKAVFDAISSDVSKTLNALNPAANQDLFANSNMGRSLSAYSAPARRAMKQLEGYWKSGWDTKEGITDKARLGTVLVLNTLLAGRGVIPGITVAGLLGAGAAATGSAEKQERQYQWLDQLNALHSLTGLNYGSGGFGPDYFSGAQPTIQAFATGATHTLAALKNAHSATEVAIAGAGAVSDLFALLPVIGPFGRSKITQLYKNLEAASQGAKKQYFTDGPFNAILDNVTIPYNYHEALRDWVLGGENPLAHDAIEQKRLHAAQKYDAGYNGPKRDLLPTRSSAELRDVFPTVNSQ